MHAGLLAEPAQELLGVLAVQLLEVGDLGVRAGQPVHQSAQCVAGMTDGLRSVEVRSQVQPEVPLDHGTDPRRCLRRREVIGPGSCIDASGGCPVDLADVEQQDLHGMHPRDRGPEVIPGRIRLVCNASGARVEISQRIHVETGGEPVNGRAEFVQVVDGQGTQIGIAAVQQHSTQRPFQLLTGAGRCVAELNQPSDMTVEQFDIHAQSAVVHGVGERAGECPAEQDVVVQADAVDQ